MKAECRVLVVDDYEPFRSFVSSTLRETSTLQIIGEASDGLEAVRKAGELQPDLILLDIALPKLNGIRAAEQMQQTAPHSRILFVSEHSSPELVEGALRVGAVGYLIKSHAASELLPAIKAVLREEQFVSSSVAVVALPTHKGP
jgi:two-component system nitrate/nitrite response regulator NarL